MLTLALTVVVVSGVLILLVALVRDQWRTTPVADQLGGEAAWWRWLIRGLLVPVAGWWIYHLVALIYPNSGWTPFLAVGQGSWIRSWIGGSTVASLLIGIAWAGVTFAWLVPSLTSRVRRREVLQWRLGWLAGATTLLFAWLAWRGSWTAGLLLLVVAAWLALRISKRLIHRPQVVYHRAVASLKFGKYADAEQEVLRQLEEKEDDYEGWMLLAALYAEQFGQMADAEATVRELIEQPGLSPFQISQALQRLADWHLKFSEDPAAARAALAEIPVRCPGTPFARSAEQRLHRLPADSRELREQKEPRRLALPALSAHRADAASEKVGVSPVQLMEAREEAQALAARLERRPEDVETRLRLARLQADRLGRLEEAVAEVRRVRALKDVPRNQAAEALALEAAWELRRAEREPVARTLLEQLIRDYSDQPQAIAARRQLQLLDDAAYQRTLPAQPAFPAPPTVRLRVLPPAADSA